MGWFRDSWRISSCISLQGNGSQNYIFRVSSRATASCSPSVRKSQTRKKIHYDLNLNQISIPKHYFFFPKVARAKALDLRAAWSTWKNGWQFTLLRIQVSPLGLYWLFFPPLLPVQMASYVSVSLASFSSPLPLFLQVPSALQFAPGHRETKQWLSGCVSASSWKSRSPFPAQINELWEEAGCKDNERSEMQVPLNSILEMNRLLQCLSDHKTLHGYYCETELKKDRFMGILTCKGCKPGINRVELAVSAVYVAA